MAGQTLHSGLELPLEQRYNDGFVQQLVFAPCQVGCHLIIQMVVFLLLVTLSVVRLTPEMEKQHDGTQEQLQPTKADTDYQTILVIIILLQLALKKNTELTENYRLNF